MSIYGYFACMTITCFVLTALITRWLIPVLKSKKMGQKILDIGPRWHKSKEGTPSMGGLSFLAVVTIAGTILLLVARLNADSDSKTLLGGGLTLLLAAANGAVGIIDDAAKFRKKENEGLTAPQKYLLQLVCAAFYLGGMKLAGLIDGTVGIPFTDITLDLGVFYYFFALILITGVVNSVNLTDGVDGLLSLVSFVIGCFLLLAGMKYKNTVLVILASGIIGAAAGFLVYNYHPARVFMGDTGSLYLGGLFAGSAFLLGQPLLIVLYGIIFITESVSVILQVMGYKLTKKRLFRMAPIHHHFEMCGWSELAIGYVFSAITVCACALSWFAL